MAVRRDNKGIWRYRKVVEVPDGSKMRVSGTPAVNTKLEAEAAERAHIMRLVHPMPQEKKEVPRFGEFVRNRWFPVYPQSAGNRPSSIAEKESHLRLYLLPSLAGVRLDQVRGEVVDTLASERSPANDSVMKFGNSSMWR